MNIFPFISPPPNLEDSNNFPLYREIAWDFKKNEPIIENGEFKIVEGNEAIKVWVYKSLLTANKEFSIYSWDYGTELYNLIGKPYTRSLINSEAKRYIEEALLINPYILEVNVIDSNFEGWSLTCNIKITTIYGESEVNI